jgi:glycerol-3-phosphate acyltransferase PlsY
VATSLGSFALIAPKSIVCAVAILIVVIAIFRFVSLGSVTAALTFPLLVWILHEYTEPGVLLLLATASVLVIWKHRENISRLAAGTEPKVRSSPEAGKP